jgi:phage-related protein
MTTSGEWSSFDGFLGSRARCAPSKRSRLTFSGTRLKLCRWQRGAERRTPRKPFKGGSGIFEIALRRRGDAFRVIYAVQLDEDLWVVHTFQKKSKSGIKTPQVEVDLIREKLKRLKEALK